MTASTPESDVSPFVADLRASMAALRPLLPVRRAARDVANVPLALAKTSHVFLRVDAVRRPLTPPYDGPYLVLRRNPKTFTILKNNKETVVSIDRLKPAFMDFLPPQRSPSVSAPLPVPVSAPVPSPPLAQSRVDPPVSTRSGRSVRAPVRFGVSS